MVLTIQHLIDLIDALPKNEPFDYVIPGENKVIVVTTSEDSVRMDKLKSDGSRKSCGMSKDILECIVDNVQEGVPFSVDSIFNGSGSGRSAWEAVLSYTTEFYKCRVGRQKHLIWMPSEPHELGIAQDYNGTIVNNDSFSPEHVKQMFAFFLERCCKTSHRTDKNPLYLSGNAPVSYMSFLEPQKLFDYNPQKWSHIRSLYEITNHHDAEKIFTQLLADSDFVKRDTENNQGWRSGAIGYYVCFLNAFNQFSKVINKSEKNQTNLNTANPSDQPLQQIFYGAPGTGKSHEIEQLTNGSKVFRTTFHPDSDYSTFVGAYKPIMREVPMTTVIGTKVVPVEDKEGNPLYESKIQYEFVPQAFAQAYVEAWQDLDTPVYLVIEEINRGNCAQIFGDIFQLLDRKKSGFSNYYIVPDEDLRQYIAKAFKDGIDERAFEIIKTGKNLCLPPNLYIWATMNTSDQSLFPIDSAFKRRWDWQYIPIENAELGWKINVNGNSYDWWEFLQAINKEVFTLTLSEDKQLGYFFVQAKDNIIDAKVLVNKVFFYLWNDVFKDFDMDNSKVFRQAEGQNSICFKDFYASVSEIKEDIAEQILINLGLEKEAK